MKVHIVLAHPEPRSFNSRLANAAVDLLQKQGHEVSLTDLYACGFQPAEGPEFFAARRQTDRFDVQAEQKHAFDTETLDPFVADELQKLRTCDLLILQYPNWWFMPPAMMKGWVDRVLVYGATYNSKDRYDRGLLKGRRAIISVTFGGPESTFAHNGRNGDVDLLLWPMQMSLAYLGMTVLPPFTAFGVGGDLDHLDGLEKDYLSHLAAIPEMRPLRFNGWDDWDASGRLKPGVEGHNLYMRAVP